MGFTCKNRKHIVKFDFAPLVFILLLALSFKILGGTSSESHLKKIKDNQSIESEYCTFSNNDTRTDIKTALQIKQLLDADYSGITIDRVVLLFISFILIYRSTLFCKRSDTLVSLCVRMDD